MIRKRGITGGIMPALLFLLIISNGCITSKPTPHASIAPTSRNISSLIPPTMSPTTPALPGVPFVTPSPTIDPALAQKSSPTPLPIDEPTPTPSPVLTPEPAVIKTPISIRSTGPALLLDIVWSQQIASADIDHPTSVAVDGSGNSYIAGHIIGAFPDQTNFGERDAYLIKYDSFGNEVWTRQFGSSKEDFAQSVTVDSSGNIYVTGSTTGALPGQSNLGSRDAFLKKFASDGNEIWTRQFGSSKSDNSVSVDVDASGNIYVAGYTDDILPRQSSSGNQDAFLRKYHSDGNEIWTRQFGSSRNDSAESVSTDSNGNIYVAGVTLGSFPGQSSVGGINAFLRKYTSDGDEVWTRQFGSSNNDFVQSATVDGLGNVYVTGFTYGVFPGQSNYGGVDIFLTKYESTGKGIWTRQFGSSKDDYVESVASDGSGNIYVVGATYGSLIEKSGSESGDAFLSKYNSEGTNVWIVQFRISNVNRAQSVTVDRTGNIYMAGLTGNVFPGQPGSRYGIAFLIKVTPKQSEDP